MAYLKLQQGRAIDVVPNDEINIPSPSAVSAVGVNESDGTSIVDSTKDFTKSVKIGDVVYNTTSLKIAKVISIDSADTVTISDDIFTSGVGDGYKIFSTTDIRTEACVLYTGSGGTIRVITSSGDDVTFKTAAAGIVLPVQVVRVLSADTTATGLVALW